MIKLENNSNNTYFTVKMLFNGQILLFLYEV